MVFSIHLIIANSTVVSGFPLNRYENNRFIMMGLLSLLCIVSVLPSQIDLHNIPELTVFLST